MSNLLTRTLTGAVFLVVMVGGILWNFWSYTVLFSSIALLGTWEFYTLMKDRISTTQKIAGLAIGMILILASCGKYFYPVSYALFTSGLFLLVLAFPVYLIYHLFRPPGQFTFFSPVLFGILYVIAPFCLLLISYSSGSYWSSINSSHVILGFFFLIWSNDTFAYLVGIAVGRTKLFERISPKKTWEGFIGGVACTQGIAYLLSIFISEPGQLHWHAIALIVSVTGTLGDLVESMFKRTLGVKDSGNILPGHGGILDRFDAVLISAPFVVVYLLLVR